MSRPQIAVAGSGKMARDVGLYFLGRGHPVAWISRDPGRLLELERWVARRAGRLVRQRAEEGLAGCAVGAPSFFLVGGEGLPAAEVFIECINEAEEDKRALLAALERQLPEDAIRVSNSSSIFPDRLHDQCAGLHFFYPVELTGFVEAVFPEGFSRQRRQRLLELLAETRLECIEEDEPEAAFAVNRLLLPLQAEALSAVMAGLVPTQVDRASSSAVLPVGQLALMDRIGLDVVHPAVCNFAARLEPEVARHYAPLREGLARLLALGKRGHKNRDGLLEGAPLPWPPSSSLDGAALADRFRCLFVNTCFHALERGLIGPEKLALALAALFDWSGSLDEALAPLDRAHAAAVLAEAFDETGRLYFVPAAALRNERRGWPTTGLVI